MAPESTLKFDFKAFNLLLPSRSGLTFARMQNNSSSQLHKILLIGVSYTRTGFLLGFKSKEGEFQGSI